MEVQVEARNLEVRKVWQDKISDEKEKLIRHHAGLVHRLRVTIEGTTHHKGGGYELSVVASIPNDTIVVKRKGEAVRTLLGDAFDTLGLQLKEFQRKRRQSAKAPQNETYFSSGTGLIKSLFPYESYGFITKPNGQDVYFHKNSLKDITMEDLAEGDEVKFGEAEGDKGPCAAWVKAAAK